MLSLPVLGLPYSLRQNNVQIIEFVQWPLNLQVKEELHIFHFKLKARND
jgi:hypothetical protein